MKLSPAKTFAALVALGALLLSACSGTEGTATPAPPPPGFQPSQLLTMAPSGATSASVVNHQHYRKRWGMEKITSESSKAEQGEYVQKVIAERVGSELDQLGPAMDGWGWSGLDVDWEARLIAQGPPINVYRLRDSLNMDTVTKSLTDNGFKRVDLDGGRSHFTRDLKSVKAPLFLTGVTVVPDQHLLIGGPKEAAAALGDRSKEFPELAELLSAQPTGDVLLAAWGDRACAVGRSTPAQQNDNAGLKKISAWAATVLDPDKAVVTTRYAGEADAAADLAARTKLLTEGASMQTREPYSKLLTAKVSQNGAALKYELETKRPALIFRMYNTVDLPWARCPAVG